MAARRVSGGILVGLYDSGDVGRLRLVGRAVQVTVDARRNCLAASTIPAAIQRSDHLPVLPALGRCRRAHGRSRSSTQGSCVKRSRCEGLCTGRVSLGVVGPHVADDDVGEIPFVGAGTSRLVLCSARLRSM
jgi:hypothetical protein